jgi:hypothetical protein
MRISSVEALREPAYVLHHIADQHASEQTSSESERRL